MVNRQSTLRLINLSNFNSFQLGVSESEIYISSETVERDFRNQRAIVKELNLGRTSINVKMDDNASPFTNTLATLQYAVESVPFFDDQNMPVEHFIEGCELARSMLPSEAEVYLTKIVHARLTGEDRRAMIEIFRE